MTLLFRDGRTFNGRALGTAEKPYTIVQDRCRRCGGAGRSEAWRYTGYVCFDCGGSGRGGEREAPLYTQDKLDRLNAIAAKKAANKAAKAEVARIAREAETEARRATFHAKHADLLPWLENAGRTGADYREGFLGDMLRLAHDRAQWSEAQEAAVYRSHAKAIERKALAAGSQHVGNLGERITATVTVERESSYERTPYMGGYCRDTETVYITTLRTDDGAALVVKSPRFREAVGSKLTIRGTVKEHSEFRGEKQTILSRVTVVSTHEKEEINLQVAA